MSELLDAIAGIDTRVVLVAALLVLDVWAIGMTLASDASRKEKVLWSGIVILCPIIGCLFWFSLGPKPNLIGT
ncbi:MAG: PLDc N-terminal domain-containing protein [Gemmatimonadales bacterium]